MSNFLLGRSLYLYRTGSSINRYPLNVYKLHPMRKVPNFMQAASFDIWSFWKEITTQPFSPSTFKINLEKLKENVKIIVGSTIFKETVRNLTVKSPSKASANGMSTTVTIYGRTASNFLLKTLALAALTSASFKLGVWGSIDESNLFYTKLKALKEINNLDRPSPIESFDTEQFCSDMKVYFNEFVKEGVAQLAQIPEYTTCAYNIGKEYILKKTDW